MSMDSNDEAYEAPSDEEETEEDENPQQHRLRLAHNKKRQAKRKAAEERMVKAIVDLAKQATRRIPDGLGVVVFSP